MANTLQIRTTKQLEEQLKYLMERAQVKIDTATAIYNNSCGQITKKEMRKSPKITKSEIIKILIANAYYQAVDEDNKAIDEAHKEEEAYLSWLEEEGYIF